MLFYKVYGCCFEHCKYSTAKINTDVYACVLDCFAMLYHLHTLHSIKSDNNLKYVEVFVACFTNKKFLFPPSHQEVGSMTQEREV